MKRIRRRKERSGECDGGVLKWSGEERSDSERNGRTPPSSARSDGVSEWPPDRTSESPPDPEVAEKATRRRFTAEYKVRIVREADGCREPGQIGALLRREGLSPPSWSTGGRSTARGRIERCGMTIGAGNGNAVRWKRRTNGCATRRHACIQGIARKVLMRVSKDVVNPFSIG